MAICPIVTGTLWNGDIAGVELIEVSKELVLLHKE